MDAYRMVLFKSYTSTEQTCNGCAEERGGKDGVRKERGL